MSGWSGARPSVRRKAAGSSVGEVAGSRSHRGAQVLAEVSQAERTIEAGDGRRVAARPAAGDLDAQAIVGGRRRCPAGSTVGSSRRPRTRPAAGRRSLRPPRATRPRRPTAGPAGEFESLGVRSRRSWLAGGVEFARVRRRGRQRRGLRRGRRRAGCGRRYRRGRRGRGRRRARGRGRRGRRRGGGGRQRRGREHGAFLPACVAQHGRHLPGRRQRQREGDRSVRDNTGPVLHGGLLGRRRSARRRLRIANATPNANATKTSVARTVNRLRITEPPTRPSRKSPPTVGTKLPV